MTHTVEWFFGRGLSIGCGLEWAVPPEWGAMPRPDQIARIKAAILSEMSSQNVGTSDIKYFLELLAAHTVQPWRHQFHTTNWDYLLQREISALGLTVQPPWCAETHVYHLNGTVEDMLDNTRRSKFVLESDLAPERVATTEGEIAFNKFIWSQTFVVVGMSFECDVDKYLLSALNRVQDDLPIGDSRWVVVNRDTKAMSVTCERLQRAVPRAKIIGNATEFGAWLHAGVPELQTMGVISF